MRLSIFKRERKPDKSWNPFKRKFWSSSNKSKKTRTSKKKSLSPEIWIENGGLLKFSNLKSFELEQFKALRTKLLFPNSGRRPRSFVITSVDFGEGKSFVASNLALTIANNIDNRQTLLIDCDMRLPFIHHIFSLGKVPGLSEYLSNNLPLAPFLIRPQIENLTILPAGTPPNNPGELLCSKKMLALIEEVSSAYDDRYVLIDLPPPKIVSEASIIARKVDGIIIVVKYGKTPKDKVYELIEMFGREHVVGIVINQFDTSMHSAAYRMYRKYISRERTD